MKLIKLRTETLLSRTPEHTNRSAYSSKANPLLVPVSKSLTSKRKYSLKNEKAQRPSSKNSRCVVNPEDLAVLHGILHSRYEQEEARREQRENMFRKSSNLFRNGNINQRLRVETEEVPDLYLENRQQSNIFIGDGKEHNWADWYQLVEQRRKDRPSTGVDTKKKKIQFSNSVIM